ncbi:MAG: Wzz/FepE/Etk N-terminal domain-containing protein [Halioglobus sp.]|nr:Wzz/FepE/Etk N-terminal domain-containing protein [Halioglobus sp.]
MNSEEEYVKSMDDYVAMLKRRKWAMIIPAVVVFASAIILAFALPPVYQSQATILVQQQAVANAFVQSSVNSFAEQQVQTISQRVLTVANIGKIVEEFNLYGQAGADTASRLPGTELASLFREDLDVEMVNSQVIDPNTGRATQVTIAFTLAFKAGSKKSAQQVATKLVTLFLDENLTIRAGQADSTAQFFEIEGRRLTREVSDIGEELAQFKALNEGSLPQLYQYNLNMLQRNVDQLSNTKIRLQELKTREIEIASRLAQISPFSPVTLPTGELVLSDSDRLKAAQSDYRRKSAIYNDNHPDVVRLYREIQVLQAELGVETDVDDLRQQLQGQKRHLGELQSKYLDSHQDIKNTQQLIGQLEASIRSAGSAGSVNYTPEADNPAYVLLSTQLSATKSEVESILKLQTELQEKVERYEEIIKTAPDVEKDYEALQRDYRTAVTKYQEVKSRQQDAQMSKSMEANRKGERFILIEPPVLPSEPASPNRPAIMFLGLLLGVGTGVGLALLREALDSGIQSTGELGSIMGEPPLVTIPYIENELDATKDQKSRRLQWLTMAVGGIVILACIHFFYMPLNVLYFVIFNKLGFS